MEKRKLTLKDIDKLIAARKKLVTFSIIVAFGAMVGDFTFTQDFFKHVDALGVFSIFAFAYAGYNEWVLRKLLRGRDEIKNGGAE